MVDYSKWDNLVVSSDEEDVRSNAGNQPEVTRLSKPSKVTFGNGAVRYEPSAPKPPSRKPTKPKQKSRSAFALNGADNGAYLWSQTGEEVCITVLLPASAKARDVNLSLSNSGRLLCSYQGKTLLEGQLCRDVWGAAEARVAAMKAEGKVVEEGFRVAHPQLLGVTAEKLEAQEMEWSVEDAPKEVHDGRLLTVTLKKLPPNDQIKEEWWDRLFVSETRRVDTGKIASRKDKGASGKTFQDAWEEAHTEFVRRRKEGQPLELSKR